MWKFSFKEESEQRFREIQAGLTKAYEGWLWIPKLL